MCVCETKDELSRHGPALSGSMWQPKSKLKNVLEPEKRLWLADNLLQPRDVQFPLEHQLLRHVVAELIVQLLLRGQLHFPRGGVDRLGGREAGRVDAGQVDVGGARD